MEDSGPLLILQMYIFTYSLKHYIIYMQSDCLTSQTNFFSRGFIFTLQAGLFFYRILISWVFFPGLFYFRIPPYEIDVWLIKSYSINNICTRRQIIMCTRHTLAPYTVARVRDGSSHTYSWPIMST